MACTTRDKAIHQDDDKFFTPVTQVRINGGTNIAAAISGAGKMLKKNAAAAASARNVGDEDVEVSKGRGNEAKVIIFITDGRVDGFQVCIC